MSVSGGVVEDGDDVLRKTREVIRMFFGGCIGTTVQLITWNVDELRSSLGI